MGSALRDVMVRFGLREPDATDYEPEYREENGETGKLGEVHEFPGSTQPDPLPQRKQDSQSDTEGFKSCIRTVKPQDYNRGAQEVGNYVREGIPVILNLEGLSSRDAQRFFDFTSGLCYGLHGSAKQVTPRVFLLSPKEIKVVEGEGSAPYTSTFSRQF